MVQTRPGSSRGSVRGKGWDAFARPVPGNVLRAIEELGLEVKRVTADEIEMPCPEHFNRTGKIDRHPSFSVNLEEGYFNCFSCGYRGPFVKLAKDALGVDWEEAVRWVRSRGGIERVRKKLGIFITDPNAASYSTEIDTTKVINEASLALFEDPPEEALDERGISLEAAQHFGIVWDPKRDMWITPIRGPETGTLWGWQEKAARYFRNRPYDVKKAQAVFGLDAFEDGYPAVLVESPLDTAYVWTHLPVNGLSGYGAGVSDVQMRLIHEVTDVLYVALDDDRDGHKYSEWIRTEYGRKMRLKFWDYADGHAKDPGEQTVRELEYSFDHAYPSTVARFA